MGNSLYLTINLDEWKNETTAHILFDGCGSSLSALKTSYNAFSELCEVILESKGKVSYSKLKTIITNKTEEDDNEVVFTETSEDSDEVSDSFSEMCDCGCCIRLHKDRPSELIGTFFDEDSDPLTAKDIRKLKATEVPYSEYFISDGRLRIEGKFAFEDEEYYVDEDYDKGLIEYYKPFMTDHSDYWELDDFDELCEVLDENENYYKEYSDGEKYRLFFR